MSGPERPFRVRRYGDRALLVDTPAPLAVAAALTGWSGVVDVVPGAASVLVVTAAPALVGPLAEALAAGGPPGGAVADAVPDDLAGRDGGPVDVEIPVVYDGTDLAEVGELTGLGADAVRRRHAAGTYTVAVVGFAPGFAYLSGLDPALAVPRREDPRPSVPAGSVAIGGAWTGCYPRATPGGWRLLGRTGAPLWSLDRTPPALLRPGLRVRFVDATP